MRDRNKVIKNFVKKRARTFYFTFYFFDGGFKSYIYHSFSIIRILDDIVDNPIFDKNIRVAVLINFNKIISALFLEESIFKKKLLILTTKLYEKKIITLLEKRVLEIAFQNLHSLAPELKNYFIKMGRRLIKGFSYDLTNNMLLFSTKKALDKYTYDVAGSIGNFINQGMNFYQIKYINHFSKFEKYIILMGKSAQIINIVTDVWEDYKNDRHYIPDELMQRYGIKSPQELFSSPHKLAMIHFFLLRSAYRNLQSFWICAYSFQSFRYRIAFGVLYLMLMNGILHLSSNDYIKKSFALHKKQKITKWRVYKVMMIGILGGIFPAIGKLYGLKLQEKILDNFSHHRNS